MKLANRDPLTHLDKVVFRNGAFCYDYGPCISPYRLKRHTVRPVAQWLTHTAKRS